MTAGKMEKISIWKGKNIESFTITPERKYGIFSQNLLVQFLHLDDLPLFLALSMNKDSTFEDLLSLLKNSGYRSEEDAEKMISNALDTLLDYGILKAEWRQFNSKYRRYFINRNELFNLFLGFEGQLMRRVKEIENFASIIRELRSRIYLGEAMELPFDDCYYENRIHEIEIDFINFVKNCLNKPEYDVLVPLPRKAWAIFEHLKEKHEIEPTATVQYGIYPNNLKDKRICIFDDAVNEGRQLYNILTILLKRGVPKENITLTAFLVNRNRYLDNTQSKRKDIEELLGKEVLYYKALNDLEFHRKVADILMYIGSFGSIIDPDHLVVNAELSKPVSGKDVISILQDMEVGNVLEPGLNLHHLHPTKKKITIDRVDYTKLTGKPLPESIDKIEQCKIRMIWEYDPKEFLTQKFVLTPIINPIIADKKAVGCEKTFLRFCYQKEISNLSEDNKICVDCTLYSMVPNLLESFLDIFGAKLPTQLHITDIKWIEFESKYDKFPLINEWKEFKKKLLEKYT
jgi:hypothetical protein